MRTSDKLRSLLSDFPLSPGWATPELYSERAKVGSLSLSTVGLSTERSGFPMITGSAVGDDQDLCVVRAYFELLERASVVEAATNGTESYQLWTVDRKRSRRESRRNIFPESPDPEQWRYSLSSGAACHTEWATACANAGRELVERDTVLRSWFTGSPQPVGTHIPSDVELPETHAFEAYELRGELSNGKTDFVTFCLGFPNDHVGVLSIGFGCKGSLRESIRHSVQECLQRLAFLVDEPVNTIDPEFSPSPDYHQDFYANPKNWDLLRSWVRPQNSDLHHRNRCVNSGEIWYADISPPSIAGKAFVVKAYYRDAIPLFFGRSSLELVKAGCGHSGIHPIA